MKESPILYQAPHIPVTYIVLSSAPTSLSILLVLKYQRLGFPRYSHLTEGSGRGPLGMKVIV